MNDWLYTLIITGLTFLLFSTNDLYAQTRLGLQVTQEELNIWRERAENGPFKSRGDVCINSIGSWDRVVSYKDNFVKKGHLEFWEDSGTDPLSGCRGTSEQTGLQGRGEAYGQGIPYVWGTSPGIYG